MICGVHGGERGGALAEALDVDKSIDDMDGEIKSFAGIGETLFNELSRD